MRCHGNPASSGGVAVGAAPTNMKRIRDAVGSRRLCHSIVVQIRCLRVCAGNSAVYQLTQGPFHARNEKISISVSYSNRHHGWPGCRRASRPASPISGERRKATLRRGVRTWECRRSRGNGAGGEEAFYYRPFACSTCIDDRDSRTWHCHAGVSGSEASDPVPAPASSTRMI